MTETGLRDAAQRLRGTLETLEQVHRELACLAEVRSGRRWTAEEYDRYLLLVGAQRRSMRSCLAAHRAFDAARRRTWSA